MGQEFFVPARTLIAVKLLKQRGTSPTHTRRQCASTTMRSRSQMVCPSEKFCLWFWQSSKCAQVDQQLPATPSMDSWTHPQWRWVPLAYFRPWHTSFYARHMYLSLIPINQMNACAWGQFKEGYDPDARENVQHWNTWCNGAFESRCLRHGYRHPRSEFEFCGGSVQANIEYLYIRSYGQTASVTSNLRVYSRT